MSASLSLIDFPNPSYLSPSFEVRRVEVYLHLNGLVERRRVEPLQIVEKGRQRMFRPREDAPEHQLQTALCLLRQSSWTGGCSPMRSFKSGTTSSTSRPFGSRSGASIAVMYLGVIVEEADCASLFAAPYTRALLSSVPVPDPDFRQEQLVLNGEIPSPTKAYAGCRLRSRCPLAEAVCAEPVPRREVTPGHHVPCHLT